MPWSEAGTSPYPPHQALGLELVVATLKRGADGVPGGCHKGKGSCLRNGHQPGPKQQLEGLILRRHSFIRFCKSPVNEEVSSRGRCDRHQDWFGAE